MTTQQDRGEAALKRLTGAGISPTRASAAVALVYLVAASAYILVSGSIVEQMATSVAHLERLEKMKGIAFIVVTALLMFLVNLTLLRRMRRHEDIERRMERSLANAERSVLAGTFARTIAHDINNALSPAMLTVSLLEDAVAENQEAREYTATITSSLQRVAEWNRRFFEIGGKLTAQAGRFDLAQSISAAVTLARHHRSARKAQIEVRVAPVPDYHGIDSVIQRAVLNLVLNAVEAAGPEARIVVELTPGTTHHTLCVDDNGPGVPAAMRAQVLEPFFTSKAHGTGLGLSSVLACARLHGGEVAVLDAPTGGARFLVILGPLDPVDPLHSATLGEGPSARA
jgi:two-component system sensor histidine kinase HydH